MRRFFNGLVLGLLVGAGATWYFMRSPQGEKLSQAESQFQEKATDAIYAAGEALKAKKEALQLRSEDIAEQLVKGEEIVRRKARDVGAAVADATADARVTAAIKAKLAMDKELSAWGISVTTDGGVVELSGTVSSEDQIGKAIMLALETDGVREVKSNLQVKK